MLKLKKALVFGEGRLCIQCIELLIDEGWVILVIISDDAIVINWANSHSIKCWPFSQLSKIVEDDFYIFSIINPHIIPKEFLNKKNIYLGLNYHDSYLPKYAGINSTTWAIINGDTTHGVTLHQINAGIDTGDIAEQTMVDIVPDETAFSLNLKCSEQLLVIFKSIINKIANDSLKLTPQLPLNRSYYGLKHIPENYAVINGIKDLHFLGSLTRGLEFAAEINPVATVKVYLNDRFYIVENANFTANNIHFATVKNIRGQVVDTNVNYVERYAPYIITDNDLQYLVKIKSIEKQVKQSFRDIIGADSLITILENTDFNNNNIFSATLKINDYTTSPTVLAIIYFVLIRYFHESFFASLYNANNDIPDSLYNLVEKRNFIHVSKELLLLGLGALEENIKSSLNNAPVIIKDFFYRHKLSSNTDIAIIVGQVPEIDKHKLIIVLDNNQITITSTEQYRLQVNSLLECIETTLAQKDSLLPANLASINILNDKQYKQIYDMHSHKLEFPHNKTIHKLFEEQVLKTPDNIALVYEDTKLTYHELNMQANQLANYLFNEHQVAKDMLIAVCIDRSVYMLIAILGVLKAGGAYVPIDPTYPNNRISYIVTDIGARVLITNGQYEDSLSFLKVTLIAIDTKRVLTILESQSNKNPLTYTTSSDLAYVIYTSGTTGKPKGVLQQHNNVMRLFKATEGWYNFNNQDVWTLFHSYIFDFSVWEIWGALIHGGKLVIPSVKQVKDMALFYELCYREKVSILNQTPKSFYQFIDVALAGVKDYPLTELRYIIFGGDTLQYELLLDWFNVYGYGKPALINMYGITETTVHVTYKQINASNITNNGGIGVPIPDMQVYILDNNHKLVPIGAVGELYIGGAGLARGYLNQPELTLQKFIANPFQTAIEEKYNSRLYKTGDLAYMLADGSIKYIGRNDFQVKIRGYRIELGEIEHAIRSHPNIKQAVVLAKFYTNQHAHANDLSSDKYLIAYYVAPNILKKEDLIGYLQNKLPEYMIPLYFVYIKVLPLTINGKLDISALPDRLEEITAYEHTTPQNALQAEICSVFAEVLSLDVNIVGIYDDFFTLGGDSILAIRLVGRINKTTNSQLKVYDVYKLKTVIRLYEAIQKNSDNSECINQSSQDCLELEVSEEYIAFSLVNLNKFSEINLNELEDVYPASYLQIGMLLESELDNSSGIYHDVFYYQISYEFDENKFINIWQQLINKHQLLRAKFISDSTSGWNVFILKKHEAQYTLHENVNLKELINIERTNPFNYDVAGLFRLIINRRKGSFDFIFSFHHVITDGWSVAQLTNEFIQVYAFNASIDNIYSLSYGEFVKRELKTLQDEKYINFWQNYLADAQFSRTNWKFDRNAKSDNGLFDASISLTYKESQAVYKLAKLNSISVDNVFLYAFLNTISFFLNSKDITIGLGVNNRPDSYGGDQVFGLFLNTIPFRFKLDSSKTVTKNLLDIFSHRVLLSSYKQLPYGYIKSKFPHDLYEFAFNFINFHILKDSMSAITKIGGFEKTNIPFVFTVYQQYDTNFKLELRANDAYIDQWQLEYFLNYIKITLINAINNIHQIGLDEADYRKIVYEWNNTKEMYPSDKTIHQIFEEQATKYPNKIALVYEDTTLTYEKLNQKANQLAHYLRNSFQIKGDDLIALCLDRNELMIIAILGVLKSGGAYVPIDPTYPDQRIQFILEDTNVKVILTNPHHKTQIEEICHSSTATPLLELSDMLYLQHHLAKEPINNPSQNTTSKNLAYVIYTSGTTGIPKGVMIEHSGVINLAASQEKEFKLCNLHNEKYERYALYANFIFDASVYETFIAILNGHTLHILPDSIKIDINLLSRYIRDNDIQVATIPPALLTRNILLPLQTIIVAGDTADLNILELYTKNSNVINAYGPTESTVCATVHHFKTGDSNLNIGKPISNTIAYVLDSNLAPLPIGAVGELYVGGAGSARGYLNQPELTAERFILNPFQTQAEKKQNKNSILYKTGDLVRYLPDGSIEYVGRNDFQIKIQGFRIELNEIESVLCSYPGISQCVALAMKLSNEKRDSSKYLVCYYVSDIELDNNILIKHLSSNLPSYMLPNSLIHMDKLPLTSSGKIDHKALPEPQVCNIDTYIAPRNKLQVTLCAIFAQLLGLSINKVGVRDEFFRLGGNSILAVKLLNQINTTFNIQLKVSDIFSGQTVEEISLSISSYRQKFKLITKLNRTNDKPNLFMIHPAFAGAEMYTALAEQLSNQFSCYGIDNYNFYHKNKISSLRQLATYYVAEINKIQKQTNQYRHQPYWILGASLGGQIALEIASVLEHKGIKSIKLILLDAILTDDKMLYYYTTKLKLDKVLFRKYLMEQNHQHEYVNIVLSNCGIDMKIGQQTTVAKLLYSEVLLFKAVESGGTTEYFTNYEFQNNYVLQLGYNNVNNIVDTTKITVIKVFDANHFTIINQEKLICDYIMSWSLLNSPENSNGRTIMRQITQNELDAKSIYHAIDIIDDSIRWKDCKGYYLGCNEYTVQMLGLNSREQIIGKTDYGFFDKYDADKLRNNDEIAMQIGSFIGEEDFQFNGNREYYSTTKKRVFDTNGNIVGIFSSSKRITDIKEQMEQDKRNAILEEEVKITQIIDFIPAHIYWKHNNEYYIGCNKNQRDFAGDDPVGKTEYDFLPKEEADKVHAADQYVLERGSFSGEEVGTDAHGVTKTYFSSKNQLLNASGKVVGIVGITVDISDTKEKERLELENKVYQIEKKQQNRFRKIVEQVVHDIRSPLASMQMILPLCNRLPENLRVSLNKSAIRIADIANNLLNKVKPEEHLIEDMSSRIPTLISADLLEIVTEKKYEYSKLSLDFITKISQSGYFAFINVDTKAFKRTLSNLINNAVDALDGGVGEISIGLDAVDNKVQIIIEDNGKGMPEDVKNKILNKISVTCGKDNGHGIGFSQIRDALDSNDGTLEVESEIDVGTKIILTFPRIENPWWIAEKIELYNDTLVVILDDDESIHGAWKARFKKSAPHIERKHFKDGAEVVSFINGLDAVAKNNVFLLTDYELLEQNLHGLEVIQQTGIKNSILVTSHHNNQEIRDLAKLTTTRILPKPLAPEIPINILETLCSLNATGETAKVDLVFIDDDKDFANIFKRVLAMEDKVMDTYPAAQDFLGNISKYSANTIILMDNQFERENITGIELAKQLHERGFLRLYLFSGNDYTGDSNIPWYLKPILKTDIEAVKKLL